MIRQFIAGKLRRFRRENHGVAALELGIMASVMAIAIVTFISDVDDPEGLLGRIKLLIDGMFDYTPFPYAWPDIPGAGRSICSLNLMK